MKNKLTAQDIVDFFHEKPEFNRPESSKYGWPSTSDGLYSITDMYKYFEEKGFIIKNVDDIMWKHFQTVNNINQKLDKGKTHYLLTIQVKNWNPAYKRDPNFCYYYYDITLEQANLLKKSYEEQSKELMGVHKKTEANGISIASANRKIKAAKPRVKKPVTTL